MSLGLKTCSRSLPHGNHARLETFLKSKFQVPRTDMSTLKWNKVRNLFEELVDDAGLPDPLRVRMECWVLRPMLWSTTICILSLFTTGHACFRLLDDQISTNLVQIEQVSKTPNNTFTNPKTGESHGILNMFGFVENLGRILNKSKHVENFGSKPLDDKPISVWPVCSTHRSHGSLVYFRPAKRKRRWRVPTLVLTSLFRYQAKMAISHRN